MPPPTSRPNIPPAVVAAAKASYQRCVAAPDFFTCFYRNFFVACPEAEPLFARTNFTRQHKLLRHAIGLLLSYPGQHPEELNILSRVAERHSRRDLDISPSLYPAFVDSLVKTVREHDAEFDDSIEDAWRQTLAPGVAYMQRHY
jgi:hemoglobin-like flavoprotein